MNKRKSSIVSTIAIFGFTLGLAFSGHANADKKGYYGKGQYKVSITNISKGQSFTPFLTANHKANVSLFGLGMPASDELAEIAEGGNIAPLRMVLDGMSSVASTASSAGLLAPGKTVDILIDKQRGFNRLSFAAMLLPTNDTFVSLNNVRLPKKGSKVFFARAYDAGSETNDELCASIPGPQCGGLPGSPEDDGEGFVHIASGIQGGGDLDAGQFDWNGPVAKVVIKRMW